MLNKKYCSDCYYYEHCGCSEACGGYMPLAEEAINREIDGMIENERTAFYAEWFEYIECCDE